MRYDYALYSLAIICVSINVVTFIGSLGTFHINGENPLITMFFSMFLASLFLWVGYRVSPKEDLFPTDHEISDHELMMKILNSSNSSSIKLDEIRNSLPDKNALTRSELRKRLNKLVKKGFLQTMGQNEYKPMEKDEYFQKILSDLLEKEGYTVLESIR